MAILLKFHELCQLQSTGKGNYCHQKKQFKRIYFSNDDYGLIWGNWSESFDGVDPSAWTGSVEIMQKYYETRSPVKYGQCWVFAGCLATAARAIGLPTRVVTNFCSAHDRQANLTIEYLMLEGNKSVSMEGDSVWNFHVWNEVWMKRNVEGDKTYDGFQAIDSTPQESSDGKKQCGPAPVVAIKRGEIFMPYDTKFLISEVNADLLTFRRTDKGLKLVSKSETYVGQHISTKAIGKMEREDITSTYKFSEQSKDERLTYLKLLKEADSSSLSYYLNGKCDDIEFKFEVQDNVMIGDDFNVVRN